jgi:hypothetical protein
MSLLFGNLTQDFVAFGQASNNINSNDPDSTTKLNQAAENFRRIAAKDASYLTYIGPSLITLPYVPVLNHQLSLSRLGLVRLHIHLHVYLGLYLGGDC